MKLTMTRQPRNERLPAMRHLEIGNRLFHNGVPLQLLDHVRGATVRDMASPSPFRGRSRSQ